MSKFEFFKILGRKTKEEKIKDIEKHIDTKDWNKLDKDIKNMGYRYSSYLSKEYIKKWFDNLIEDKKYWKIRDYSLIDELPKEDFIENTKRYISSMKKDDMPWSFVNDLSYLYVLWLLGKIVDIDKFILHNNNIYFNSKKLEFDIEFILFLKEKISFDKLWEINHMFEKDFFEIYSYEEIIENFKKEPHLKWNDNILEYTTNDNLIFFIKYFKSDTNLIKLIEKLDSVDCDDIELYYLVKTVIECNKNPDAIVKLLSKTNLTKKEQRTLLNSSVAKCTI